MPIIFAEFISATHLTLLISFSCPGFGAILEAVITQASGQIGISGSKMLVLLLLWTWKNEVCADTTNYKSLSISSENEMLPLEENSIHNKETQGSMDNTTAELFEMTEENQEDLSGYPGSGIYQNTVKVSKLKAKGWKVHYYHNYRHPTRDNKHMWPPIKKGKVMFGCSRGTDLLTLAAFARISVLRSIKVTRQTKLQYENGAYWYVSSGQSIGFTQYKAVSLNSADTHSTNANLRLSWHFNQYAGGWRCGNTRGLNGDSSWKKYVMYKEGHTTTTTPFRAPVQLVTYVMPEKIRWAIKQKGKKICEGGKYSDWYSAINTGCALLKGAYTLECKDIYNEGWGGGYMKINGKKLCKNYNWNGGPEVVVPFSV